MIKININENLLNISYLISSCYKSLSNLELEGLENTEEYSEILKRIEILTNIEDEYYNIYYNICETHSIKITTLVNEVYKRLHKKFKEKNIELLTKPEVIIFNQFDTSDISILRIINKLSRYKMNLELYKNLSEINDFDFKNQSETSSKISSLITSMAFFKSLDDINRILDIEIKNNANDSEKRNLLIEAKYDYNSIYENNFQISNYTYLKKAISRYTRINLLKYLQKKVSKINYLMSTNEKNKRKILLTRINIRAKLLNLDFEDKELLKNEIQKSIQNGDIDNLYGTNMFLELIEQSNYDIEWENTRGL